MLPLLWAAISFMKDNICQVSSIYPTRVISHSFATSSFPCAQADPQCQLNTARPKLLLFLLDGPEVTTVGSILPKQEVQNGENLTLQCVVDVSTTSSVKPQHQVLFYKDDVLFHNVSSMENTESYFIPQARVYDAGTYKCTVIDLEYC